MCLGGADKMQSLDMQIYYNQDMHEGPLRWEIPYFICNIINS